VPRNAEVAEGRRNDGESRAFPELSKRRRRTQQAEDETIIVVVKSVGWKLIEVTGLEGGGWRNSGLVPPSRSNKMFGRKA